MYIDKELIGKKIKEYRKKKNLSQAELAELVGLSDKHIGRIEAGKYFPNFLNFINIMEAVELDFSVLGLNCNKNGTEDINELLKIIYNSTEKERKLYLRLIRAVNETDV